MTAALVPVLLFIVGLAIDFGVMYAVRNSAQNAADAAALAGVYEYACGQAGGNCPALLPPYTTDTTGNTAAQNAFAANPFLGSSTATLTPTPGGYQCPDVNGVQYSCYKATVTTNSPTFFSKVFGKQSVPITVVSTARASTGLGYSPSCVRPVFVPDSAIPCTYSGGVLSCPLGVPYKRPGHAPEHPSHKPEFWYCFYSQHVLLARFFQPASGHHRPGEYPVQHPERNQPGGVRRWQRD